jgi:hypothetical protein
MGKGDSVFISYMSKRSQVIEIIRLVTLLMGGLGAASAYAQAPTFSAPALPPIPGAPPMPGNASPAIPASPGIVSPPGLDISRVDAPPSPGLSDLTQLPVPGATNKDSAPHDDALADLPPPVAPESSEIPSTVTPPSLTTAPAPSNNIAMPLPVPPPPMPGGLSLPSPPGMATASDTDSDAIVIPASSAIPDIDVADDAPARKSWQTTLKPVSTAYDTKFNYRRALLPGAIYRAGYDKENQHLPTRITREDYVKLLFENAATNNIDGTRALLNAGTDINATNPRGETPLMVARRYGAVDTASLLMARGAR